ncbi:unannotated protein [freshwater metagenome]|uniref:Unannotated protein n=1 Tax=freshwater metagenome TaxID=449393 RepID=A0A6J7ADB9_9ZZZZ
MLEAAKELGIFRIRTWPATLDIGDAKMIKLFSYSDLVFDRERETFLLTPVSQDGVKDVNRLREVR